MRHERIDSFGGGWVRWQASEPEVTAYVKVQDRAARLVITELYVVADDGIGTDTVRALPLGRIDSAVNGVYATRIRERLREPGPDLRRLASYVGTEFGTKVSEDADWVARSFLAQVKGSGERQARMSRFAELKADEPAYPEVTYALRTLSAPEGRNHGDDFYRRVAALYRDLSALTRAPAVAIAEGADVPVTTARRWIKEARARGFLPAGRAGKAG